MAKSIKVVLELDDANFNRGLKGASGSVDSFDNKTKSSSSTLGIFAAGLAAASAAAIGLGSAVNAARSVEDLGITLETLYGDATLAAQALEIVKQKASELPVALDAIQRGVPSLALVEEKMGGLGKAIEFTSGVASAFGMSFDEAAVQVQRALTTGINSAEMFKDKGVAAFMGFEAGATVTAEQTREVFLKNFDKITAANAKAAQSMTGQFSMVGDAVFQVQEAVGTAFNESLKEVVSSFLSSFADNKDDILETAKAIGENLGTALKFLADNLDVIVPVIAGFGAAWIAIKFVAIAQGVMGIRAAVTALNVAIMANPIGAIAGAIAFASVMIIQYWDDIKVAAVQAADMAVIGFKHLEVFFYDKLGPALGMIVDKFGDVKIVAMAVAAGVTAAWNDPTNATAAFEAAFANAMATLKADSTSAVDEFAKAASVANAELIVLKAKSDEATKALEDGATASDAAADAQTKVAEVVKEANTALEEQVSQWEELNNTAAASTKELKAVDGAYKEYIADLEMDVALSNMTSEARERQIALNRAFGAAAKELGVTLADLDAETRAGIEKQVTAILALKVVKEDEVKGAVDGETAKQKSLDRTLERIEENMAALNNASENAVERMKEEHDYMMETIDLYGVEKDVAEALHEYNKQVHALESKLETDIQQLRTDGHTKEADAMQKKLDDTRAANIIERDEIAKTAAATAEYQRSFEYGWRSSYARFMDESGNAAKFAGDAFTSMATGMTSALEGFIMTGKFDFGDMLESMKRVIAKFVAEKAVMSFLDFLSGKGSGGGGGGFFNAIKSIFGFADGGYIPGNKMSMVGENGPELFMPASSGTIIPNFAMNGQMGGGGASTNVTYNINAVDARSFKQLVASDPEFMYNIMLAGSRRVPQ